jgi:SAM-dependent methyltransferase
MASFITRTSCPCCGSVDIVKALACKDFTVSSEIFDIMECGNCMLRFTQSVPDQDSIGAYYQSDTYISHTDTENGLVNKLYLKARNYTLAWKIKLLDKSAGNQEHKRELLDIGAGTGAFLDKAHHSGWVVTGLEPDQGARKICLDKYGIQSEMPEKLFELPAQKYDAVTMWHVLEHVHQLHEYLEQIKRVLKPGGVALIALPNYTSKDAAEYKSFWAAYDVPRHLYHFSPQSMDFLATKHGMKLESMRPMWLDAFYIAMLSEQYKSGKGNLLAAFWNGFNSNVFALKDKKACSSLVYLLRKDDIEVNPPILVQ